MNQVLKLIGFLLIAVLCSSCQTHTTRLKNLQNSASLEQHWQPLPKLPLDELNKIRNTTQNSEEQGWVSLAIITKQSQSRNELKQALENWQHQYPQHAANAFIELKPSVIVKEPKNIAVLLPLSGENKEYGLAVQKGILAAYYSKPASALSLTFYDTAQNQSANLYEQAAKSGADLIIGPLMEDEINNILSRKITVPTITLDLSAKWSPQPLLFGLSFPEEELAQLTAYKMAKLGYRNVFVIIPKNASAQHLYSIFQQACKTFNMNIIETVEYQDSTSLNETLEKHMLVSGEPTQPQRRQDIDSIFLIADPILGRQAKSLLNYYFAFDLPTFSLPTIYAGPINPQRNHDLDGVIFADHPGILDKGLSVSLQTALRAWPNMNQYRLYFIKGVNAYSTAMNLDKLMLIPELGISEEGTRLLLSKHIIQPEAMWFQFQQGIPQPR